MKLTIIVSALTHATIFSDDGNKMKLDYESIDFGHDMFDTDCKKENLDEDLKYLIKDQIIDHFKTSKIENLDEIVDIIVTRLSN